MNKEPNGLNVFSNVEINSFLLHLLNVAFMRFESNLIF